MNNQSTPQFKVRSDVRSGNGGYVNGVWFPDRSGVCGATGGQPPVPPNIPAPATGGGYIGGVWYGDRSGTCG